MLRVCISLLFSVLFFTVAKNYHNPASKSADFQPEATAVASIAPLQATVAPGAFPIKKQEEKKPTGKKNTKSTSFSLVYRQVDLPAASWPKVDMGLLKALESQLKTLNKNGASSYMVGNLRMEKKQLINTINLLKESVNNPAIILGERLEAHQICGADHRGNVKFTGYYTPVVEASATRQGEYKHPFHIVSHTKNGKKAINCFAKRYEDIRNIRMQGSCYVQIDNTKRIYVSYVAGAALNRIVDRGMSQERTTEISEDVLTVEEQNAPEPTTSALGSSYNNANTFVQRSDNTPMGAAHVPLLEDYTIAVDTRYIPLGSVLLGVVPMSDGKGGFSYQYRFLLAQDTGGNIKGPGHVDFYTGVGANALNQARFMSKYGKLYMLLPKS